MIEIPARGEAVCQPASRLWAGLAENNKKITAGIHPSIDRLEFRKDMFAISSEYMSSIGLDAPEFKEGYPIILSGHQPHPFHLGILYKYKMLAQISKKNLNAVWVSIDTDICEGFPLKIPSMKNGSQLLSRRMLPRSTAELYRDAKTDIDAIAAFRRELEEDISSLPNRVYQDGVLFLNKNTGSPLPYFMSDLMVSWRRAYASSLPSSVFEIPLSRICETKNFYRFAFGMLSHAREVAGLFNSTLHDYRKKHKVRSKANPFPDITENGPFVETLFWRVEEGKRVPLFVESQSRGKVVLLFGKETVEADSAEALKSACDANGVKVWPRAVALSILQRLFLSDFFIHGIGGGRYDRITDTLIRKFYGMEPPEFAVASFTPGIQVMEDRSEKLATARQVLREMVFHPEDYLEKTAPIVEMIKKKEDMVSAIKEQGADKKRLGGLISALNKKLLAELAPKQEKLKEEIEQLEAELSSFHALESRELPYFLYPPETFFGV